MSTQLRRIQRLEAACGVRIPDDLSTLTDAELLALIHTGDPAATAVIQHMTDAELEAVSAMTEAEATAFIQERMQ